MHTLSGVRDCGGSFCQPGHFKTIYPRLVSSHSYIREAQEEKVFREIIYYIMSELEPNKEKIPVQQ